jgi:divalent metal cation (Fe/Co/Zn/Cd) transporter
MHLAPRQILINAHINLRDSLKTDEIEKTIEEIEERIKKAEPKVDMIFLETARESQTTEREPNLEHIG